MAILAFQKPEQVIMLESTDTYGKFEFRPLEPGYGITIGNSLRRVLLSSLEGFAITTVRLSGVDHEFSTIPGVIEDITEIILNLKQVRFKRQVEDSEGEKILVSLTGQEEFRAGELSRYLSGFTVLNPDQLICRMEPDTKLQFEITISKGRGYVPSEENKPVEAEFGLISMDSIFTPVKNVRYLVEDYRVEQRTDYEKLTFEIMTDGSVHPKDALKESAKILIYHLMLFSDEKITLETDEKFSHEEFDEEVLHMRQLLKSRLVDLDLSVRALNCLKAAEVETLGDLVKFNKNDLLKFRNFGKKSLTELDELLESMNLNFGMDIAKYKLDKE
jgi:DNA-directed RNA polymerase subunit alpha